MNEGAETRSDAAGQMPMRLKLLGDVRFVRAPETDATPRAKRARALVAYLALTRDHSASRNKLADLFWGDRGEAQARGSLRQCLLEVRSAAGPEGADFLLSDRESVSLGRSWSSDAAEIENKLQSSEACFVADAVAQAGREVLLGSLYVSEEFDEWLTVRRAEFDRVLGEAARRGLARAIETGDMDSARVIGDQFLLRDPGDEDVTVLAMRADGLRGAAPVAHRRFQKLRDYLETELGTAPGQAAFDALAALVARPAATPAAASEAVAESAGGPPLLVVGPFQETGLAAGFGHIVSGVREEVLSGLSRFRDLRVLAEDRVPAAAESLLYGEASGAYALTATLRQSGDKIRVTPLLIRLADRSVVWSNPIKFDLTELQDAIDSIVDRIIGAVAPRLERDAVPHVSSGAVYDRYLTAKHLSYAATTHAQAAEAARQLEAVIADAPGLAAAYAPLIRLYNTNYIYTVAGIDCSDDRARAFELARTALAADRGYFHSNIVMGWCQLWRGAWDAARTHFDQALALNPYHSDRIKEAAFGFIFLGDHEAGDAYLKRSLELDPLPNDRFFEDLGFLRLMQNRLDEAVSYLDLIVEPTLFAELYTAVAATATGRASAEAAAAAWRRRVEAIWAPGVPLTNERLVAWIRLHLPFARPADWDQFERYLQAVVR